MSDTKEFLQDLMKRYTTDNVADPAAFKAKIDEFLAMDNWEMEGYTEEEKDVQRQKSIKFEWGHNHDFGSFKIDGLMGDRHINILASFIDDFGLPRDLTGKSVLDVGVWCGGTSLLLAAMGAEVRCIEEVVKYANCARFLFQEFDLGAAVFYSGELDRPLSLYDFIGMDGYDYIIFPGVLYHLSDPILALRILFNALKDGGQIFVETAVCEFSNPDNRRLNFAKGESNNIFIPSYPAVATMMEYVGFVLPPQYGDLPHQGIVIDDEKNRGFFTGYRKEWRPMLQAGLSRRIR